MAQSSSTRAASSPWKSYTKENEVGRGRKAKVFKAKEVDTCRVLAVKVFDKLNSRAEDARRRTAIKLEAKMLDAVRNGVSTMVEANLVMRHAKKKISLIS